MANQDQHLSIVLFDLQHWDLKQFQQSLTPFETQGKFIEKDITIYCVTKVILKWGHKVAVML